MQASLVQDDLRMGVDCHSMAAVSPPIAKDAGTARQLLCLGKLGDADGEVTPPFNRITCSAEMMSFVRDEFDRAREYYQISYRLKHEARARGEQG